MERKHSISRLDTHSLQAYFWTVTFKKNDYGKRESKLSGDV